MSKMGLGDAAEVLARYIRAVLPRTNDFTDLDAAVEAFRDAERRLAATAMTREEAIEKIRSVYLLTMIPPQAVADAAAELGVIQLTDYDPADKVRVRL